MSNWAGRTQTPIDNSSSKAGKQGMITGNTEPVLQRANHPSNHQVQGAVNPPSESFIAIQPLVTFEQANQQVGWQYNAGRDIIINVQSPDKLATKLVEMKEQIEQGSAHEVISTEVAKDMRQQLDTMIEYLRSDQPQAEAILAELSTSRRYLQEASVKLAQQIPQQRTDKGFSHFLAGVATLVAISFDLGLTAAVVAGLFGLAVRSESEEAT